VEAEIDRITVTIDGRRGSVVIEQTQVVELATRAGRGARRSGREMLDAALRDARVWLDNNGGSG
jgi:hypothetical protein